jgi:hypothetical protein
VVQPGAGTTVTVTDLLERPLGEAVPVGRAGRVDVRLRPFEVLTLRVSRA